ncbi:DUF1705 domain-containing protein, partial [Escherichia coli]|nr:DUF1705 domain-containing protein [Escherichia coli]
RNYGVYLDKAMLRNLMETDVREASELLQWRMLPYLLVAAVSVPQLVTSEKLITSRAANSGVVCRS